MYITNELIINLKHQNLDNQLRKLFLLVITYDVWNDLL